MKVGYFAFSETANTPNAGFVHTYNILKSLGEKGVNVSLFIGSSKNEFRGMEELNTVYVTLPRVATILKRNPIEYLKSYREIKKRIKDLDIIHERFHINPIDLLFIGDRKYVLEVNDPGIELYSGIKGRIYSYFIKKKFRRCDVIITQTETLKKILERHTEKPIYVVPNGVDTSFFKPDLENDVRVRYGMGNDEILITFVGSFREWHGVEDIPKIAEEIKKDNVRFLLVGSGHLFKEIKERSKGNKKIILVGAQPPDAIPKFLVASDILIAPFKPSKFKLMARHGFWWSPVKLYEYMASGRAIVSYDFDEVRHIVRDAGLLAEPGNFRDFSEKISLLVGGEGLRIKLGRRGRCIAEEEYSWEIRAEEVLDVYKGLANHI